MFVCVVIMFCCLAAYGWWSEVDVAVVACGSYCGWFV